MTGDAAMPKLNADWRLEKRDRDGEVFEIVEGGDSKETRVVLSKPGQPAASYYQGSLEPEEKHDHA